MQLHQLAPLMPIWDDVIWRDDVGHVLVSFASGGNSCTHFACEGVCGDNKGQKCHSLYPQITELCATSLIERVELWLTLNNSYRIAFGRKSFSPRDIADQARGPRCFGSRLGQIS